MNDALLIVLVLVVAIGSLVFVAYFLDKRGKKNKSIDLSLPKPGPIAKIFLWGARILVAIMVLSIFSAFALKSMSLVWVAGACLGLYILDGIIYRVLLTTGK